MKTHRVLIIGASGLVGSNCLSFLRKQEGFEVEGTYFSFQLEGLHYFDTLNPENHENFDIKRYRPTHILHAGALTHVDYCESHEEESYLKTVQSTKNILKLAEKLASKVIYISTDYVFDGVAGPYDEEAQVNPLSIYAKHKLEAEILVRNQSPQNLILRVTNVYGDEVRNKNFVARLWEMGTNNEAATLNLPVDQYATPVNAADVAKALFLLIKDTKSGIYNIASTDFINRVQLAQKVMTHFQDAQVNIIAKHTSELDQPALRPLQGGLKSSKFLTEYPYFYFYSVDEYLVSKLL